MATDTNRESSDSRSGSDQFWLWTAGAVLAVAVAIAGIDATFAAGHPGRSYWSSGAMVAVYILVAVVLACLMAAVRHVRFPLTPGPKRARKVVASVLPSATVHDEDPDIPSGPLGYPGILTRGPGNWLLPLSTETPEVTLRLLVALPAPVPLMSGGSGAIATVVSSEEREDQALRMLQSSRLTTWLHAQRAIWHWNGSVDWVVHGNSNQFLTELRYIPSWDHHPIRLPFAARCGIITNWTASEGEAGSLKPAIQMALDLMFNVLELDAERRPSSIRHQTTPAPAPGALRLDEIIRSFTALSELVRIAYEMAAEVMLPGDYDSGQAAAWIQVFSQSVGRVVDLSALHRLPESADASTGQAARMCRPLTARHQLREEITEMAEQATVDLLERSGYRQVRGLVEEVAARQGEAADSG